MIRLIAVAPLRRANSPSTKFLVPHARMKHLRLMAGQVDQAVWIGWLCRHVSILAGPSPRRHEQFGAGLKRNIGKPATLQVVVVQPLPVADVLADQFRHIFQRRLDQRRAVLPRCLQSSVIELGLSQIHSFRPQWIIDEGGSLASPQGRFLTTLVVARLREPDRLIPQTPAGLSGRWASLDGYNRSFHLPADPCGFIPRVKKFGGRQERSPDVSFRNSFTCRTSRQGLSFGGCHAVGAQTPSLAGQAGRGRSCGSCTVCAIARILRVSD